MITPYPGWKYEGQRKIEIDGALPPVSFEEWICLYAHYRAQHKVAMPFLRSAPTGVDDIFEQSMMLAEAWDNIMAKGLWRNGDITPLGLDVLMGTEQSMGTTTDPTLRLNISLMKATEAAEEFGIRMAGRLARENYLDLEAEPQDVFRGAVEPVAERRWDAHYDSAPIYGPYHCRHPQQYRRNGYLQLVRNAFHKHYSSVVRRLSKGYVAEFIVEHVGVKREAAFEAADSSLMPNHFAHALHYRGELGIADRELRVLRAARGEPNDDDVPAIGVYIGGFLAVEVTATTGHYRTYLHVSPEYESVWYDWNSPEDIAEVDGKYRVYAHRVLTGEGWTHELGFHRSAVERDLLQSILNQFDSGDIERRFLDKVQESMNDIAREELLESMGEAKYDQKLDLLQAYIDLLDWQAEFDGAFPGTRFAMERLGLIEVPYEWMGTYSNDAAYFIHDGAVWLVEGQGVGEWDLGYTFDVDDPNELGKMLAIQYVAEREEKGLPLKQPSEVPEWAWEWFEEYVPFPESQDQRYEFKSDFMYAAKTLSETAEGLVRE